MKNKHGKGALSLLAHFGSMGKPYTKVVKNNPWTWISRVIHGELMKQPRAGTMRDADEIFDLLLSTLFLMARSLTLISPLTLKYAFPSLTVYLYTMTVRS
jgi:hypothetical protein